VAGAWDEGSDDSVDEGTDAGGRTRVLVPFERRNVSRGAEERDEVSPGRAAPRADPIRVDAVRGRVQAG
jgi:hypothetical protein